ncbi:unnamed protein product [Prorocentrum cordatum]|uniref:Uncharacterized protein n=1 Tax=Prorocentrum cordatum TaxID=2364126 RepID=A0ABN9PQ60_9DINO|nr:unnamed protein product [Polarella glacialis]
MTVLSSLPWGCQPPPARRAPGLEAAISACGGAGPRTGPGPGPQHPLGAAPSSSALPRPPTAFAPKLLLELPRGSLQAEDGGAMSEVNSLIERLDKLQRRGEGAVGQW